MDFMEIFRSIFKLSHLIYAAFQILQIYFCTCTRSWVCCTFTPVFCLLDHDRQAFHAGVQGSSGAEVAFHSSPLQRVQSSVGLADSPRHFLRGSDRALQCQLHAVWRHCHSGTLHHCQRYPRGNAVYSRQVGTPSCSGVCCLSTGQQEWLS